MVMATSDEKYDSTGEEVDNGNFQIDQESRREQNDGEVKLKLPAVGPPLRRLNSPQSESNQPDEFLDKMKKKHSLLGNKKMYATRENKANELSVKDKMVEGGHNRSNKLPSKFAKESPLPQIVEIQAAEDSVREGRGDRITELATAQRENASFQVRIDHESHFGHQSRAGISLNVVQQSSLPKVFDARLGSSFSAEEAHKEGAIKIVTIRQENASKQVRINGQSHENHQRRGLGSVDLEQQSWLPQKSEGQMQNTFSEGDDHERSDGTLAECVWPRRSPISRSRDRSNGILFPNGESNSSIKSTIARQENILVQARIIGRGHESHVRRDPASLDLVQQSPLPQEREGQQKSAFNEREMGDRLFAGVRTAKVQASNFQQVRINRTDDRSRQKSSFTPLQSRSANESNRTPHNKLDGNPILAVGDNLSIEETNNSWKGTALVTGRKDRGKWKRRAPVHDFAGLSMQHPFQGINTAIFFLVRRHRFADEMVVSTHILATEGLTQGEIYALVNRTEVQLDAKHLPFCVEYNGLQGSARWFTNAFIEDQVKIKFQLLGQVRRNLRVINPDMAEQMITVHQIRWMSQPFMQTPGAEAPLTVEFIGPEGELCEEYIRITMEYGEITQNMLLPKLVIYCSTTIAPSILPTKPLTPSVILIDLCPRPGRNFVDIVVVSEFKTDRKKKVGKGK